MKRKQRKGKRSNASRYLTPRIPQYTAEIRQTRRIRYTTASAMVGVSITRKMLLNLFVMPTTTSASSRLINSVRIVSVEAWGQDPAFASAATEASCEWFSEDGPNVIVSSMSCGVQPAYIKTRPPKRSLASFWADSGYDENQGILLLYLPAGSTLDLTVEFTMPMNTAAVAGPTSAAHLTVGALTAVPLDDASGVLKPVDHLVFTP